MDSFHICTFYNWDVLYVYELYVYGLYVYGLYVYGLLILEIM